MSSIYVRYPMTGGGGGGMEIGLPVTGADPNTVLFVDSSGNLAQSLALTYDGTTLKIDDKISAGTHGTNYWGVNGSNQAKAPKGILAGQIVLNPADGDALPAYQAGEIIALQDLPIYLTSNDNINLQVYNDIRFVRRGNLMLKLNNVGGFTKLDSQEHFLSLIAGGDVIADAAGHFLIKNSRPPASASAAGTAGSIAWDSSYIYVCTDTDTWKRVAISTW